MKNHCNNIDISVIILTRNAEKTIGRCLNAIFSQNIDKHFEVICVDSDSEDKTYDICKEYDVRFFKINEKTFNHGLTRNFAISKARGEYIILLSQDAIPGNSNWMKFLISPLESDKEIAACYSRQIPAEDADRLTKIFLRYYHASRPKRKLRYISDREEFLRLSPQEQMEICSFDNVSSCIRKSIWSKIPFSKIDFAEDTAWAKEVLLSGKKILFEPYSIVKHSHKISILSEFFRSRIHHRVFYNLFDFNPTPSLKKALFSGIMLSFHQIYQLIEQSPVSVETFYLSLKVPFISFACTLGQYKGAREARG